MGNCALKPKVLFDGGAPVPEEVNDSLLEYQKINSAKSLSNLFLQDITEKKVGEDEKITPENMPVIKDLKTALVDDKSLPKEAMEIKSPVTEAISPTKETITVVMETKAPADDQKVKNEEVAREDKVVDVVTVKESETEAKAAAMGKEAAMKEA